jgi:hypothetical protein
MGRRTVLRFTQACTLALLLALPIQAQAQEQEWLGNRAFREGPGLRVGDYELHPGFGADFGYDSNYLLRHVDEDPIGALRIRLTPSFAITTLGREQEDPEPRTSAWRIEVGGAYNELVPLHGGVDEEDRESIRDERDFSGGALAILDLLPDHHWSSRLYAGIGRSTQPAAVGDAPYRTDRLQPEAGAELIGNLAEGLHVWRLGYRFGGTVYEASELDALNNLQNELVMRGQWTFDPRAAFLYDASAGVIVYPTPDEETWKADSYPIRARAGFGGAITRSLVLEGVAGWGSGFYIDKEPDFMGVIGRAELRWLLKPMAEPDPTGTSSSLIAVGFARDFADSFVNTYMVDTRGYIRMSHLATRELAVHAQVAGGAAEFPEQIDPDWGNPEGWTDFFVEGKLFGELRAEEWLGLNAEITYTGYFSDTVLKQPNPRPPIALAKDDLGYQQLTIFTGARVFW